jgi:hypothetical protein
VLHRERIDFGDSCAVEADRGRDGVILKPAPLLKQNTERGHYNCGDVSASYGGKLFGAKTNVAICLLPPPTSDRMADLRFDADTMRLRINSTKGLLNQGTSVTHDVTIVGYGEGTFHFIDQWPHGSAFQYAGGMALPAAAAPTVRSPVRQARFSAAVPMDFARPPRRHMCPQEELEAQLPVCNGAETPCDQEMMLRSLTSRTFRRHVGNAMVEAVGR